MSPQQRRWTVWGGLLAIAGYLAFFADKGPTQPPASVIQASAGHVRAPSRNPELAVKTEKPTSAPIEQHLVALIPRQQLIRESAGNAPDLFAAKSWTPPPPPPLPAPPAPPPTAPAMPFTYVGKKTEAGRWEVYLAQGDMNFIVHVGETVNGVYAVERIEPPLITLVYKPLGQKQTLEIGE